MEIIQKGDTKRLLKIKRFTCKECGCVFEANKTEYKYGSQYNEGYYYCNCPCCGNKVYKDERE